MKSEFYSELVQMTDDASAALSRHESGLERNDPGETFRTLRSPGFACLDGRQVKAGILEQLGPRHAMAFTTAVMRLAFLDTLGGADQNIRVRDALRDMKRLLSVLRDNASEKERNGSGTNKPATESIPHPYVDQVRIDELNSLVNPARDVRRLVRLLEELNTVHAADCYMATAMLVRAIADHLPPVFGKKNFEEVANNYPGRDSFKKSMQNLQGSLRNIADSHLHAQIRKSEVLPTAVQVDFRNDVDVLLGEVIRILRLPG